MKHPGSITIVDLTTGVTRVISANRVPAFARFARSRNGKVSPVVTVLHLEDGGIARFDREGTMLTGAEDLDVSTIRRS